MKPANATQMCEVAAYGRAQTSCVRQTSAKWPIWREVAHLADGPLDVATACSQRSSSGGKTQRLPAAKLRRQLAVPESCGCRVEWGETTPGPRSTAAIMWSTGQRVWLYLFAAAGLCDQRISHLNSIGACGTEDQAGDIEIYGDMVGGVWSYDLLDGSDKGWTRTSNSEIRAATLAKSPPDDDSSASVQNRRTLPPARNNPVQWSLPSGSVFIMGGRGCMHEPNGLDAVQHSIFLMDVNAKPPNKCASSPEDLSDMWHFDVSTGLWSCLYMPEPTNTIPSSIVTLGDQWNAEDGGLPTPPTAFSSSDLNLPERRQGAWPVARQARSSWTTCGESHDGDEGSFSHCELWLFGGDYTSGNAVGMRAPDGKVVELQEGGPVDSLWRYSHSTREPDDDGIGLKRGGWLLVSGWDDASMCRLISPSAVPDAPQCRTLTTDGETKVYPNTMLTTAAVPVELCPHVWPRNRETGEFVPFDESRCPPGRYAAAAWGDPRTGGGWVFGGLSSLHAGYTSELDLGPETHDDPMTETLLQTLLDDYKGPDGWNPALMFDDLWHFNGDAVRPQWRRLPRPASPVEASAGSSADWPMAGGGRGWMTSEPEMRLWLWIDSTEPWSKDSSSGPAGDQTLPTSPPASVVLPAELWAFSVDAQAWELIDSNDELASGHEWPAARRGELLDSSGWMLGGVGPSECAVSSSASDSLQDLQRLSGLWKWGAAATGII